MNVIDQFVKEYLRIFENVNVEDKPIVQQDEHQTNEAVVDSEKLYFHGSSNGSIQKFYSPSPMYPLFVTADIDYANEYVNAAHPNGHAKFDEDNDEGKVYLVDIDFSKVKLFDASDEDDRKKMEPYWPAYILDQLKDRKYSIWSTFKYVFPNLKKFYVEYEKDFDKFSNDIRNDKDFNDEMGVDAFLDGIKFINERYENTLTEIFKPSEEKTEDVADEIELFNVIALFNQTLADNDYNAFRNTEIMRVTKNRKQEIKTNHSIGIMDESCVKDLCPKPLDTDVVKQAIDDLKSDSDEKDYKKSNADIIQRVVDKIDDIKNESMKTESKKQTISFNELKSIILESKFDDSNIRDLDIPDDELREDLKTMDRIPSSSQKKAIAAKYNCSPKEADIRHSIAIQSRFNRFKKTEFTNDDIKMFYKLEIKSRYNDAVELLSKEPIPFLKYYEQYLVDRTKQYYGRGIYSSAEKYTISQLDNVRKYLNEINPETIKAKQDEEDSITAISNKLFDQTHEFHNDFINRAKDDANDTYDKWPKMLKKLKKDADDILANYNETLKQGKDAERSKDWKASKELFRDANEIYKKYRKAYDKADSMERLMKYYSTKKMYVDACEKNAEETFKECIYALSDRLHRKNINVQNLVVDYIDDNDPKLFKLRASDGNVSLNARSILAAQFSEKMIPHYRFIIT